MKTMYVCKYKDEYSGPCESIEEAYAECGTFNEALYDVYDGAEAPITDCTFFELKDGFQVKKSKKTVIFEVYVRK